LVDVKKIVWAPKALEDLKTIHDFIALDNVDRARTFVREMIDRVEKLTRFQKLGRVIPEIGESRYRELIVGEYRVFHETLLREILIFRVFHSKRLFGI